MQTKKKVAIIAVFIVIVLAAGACTAWKTFTGKDAEESVYYGTAEAEQIDVSAEISGRLKEIKVEEGQSIKTGSLIAVIDSPENEVKVQQSQISIESAKNELEKVEEGSRQEEINAQKAMVKQAEAQVRQAETAVTQAEVLVKQAEVNVKSAEDTYSFKKDNYEDTKALYENSAATKQELDNAQYALDQAQSALNNVQHALDNAKAQRNTAAAQVESANAQLEAAKEKLRLLVNGATDRAITSAQYGIEQAEKSYELSKLLLDKRNVVALSEGVVESVNFNIGEFVNAGSPIATITEKNNLWVKVYVPEEVLPKLKLNKEVSIRSDFLKNEVIKGKVIYISPEAEFTPMNIVTKKDRMKLVFAVKVKILEHLDEIKPGMLLDVYME